MDGSGCGTSFINHVLELRSAYFKDWNKNIDYFVIFHQCDSEFAERQTNKQTNNNDLLEK